MYHRAQPHHGYGERGERGRYDQRSQDQDRQRYPRNAHPYTGNVPQELFHHQSPQPLTTLPAGAWTTIPPTLPSFRDGQMMLGPWGHLELPSIFEQSLNQPRRIHMAHGEPLT